MISDCMKSDSPFGVLLIKDGREAGVATTYEVGTLAKVVDFYQGSDGLLGITALGQHRFRLLSSERQHDGLNVGEVELLEAEAPMPVPSDYEGLQKILANVLDDLGRLYATEGREYDNAVWLTYRLLEILPIDLGQKQQSLESSDTMARLELVTTLLDTAREPPADGA